MTQNCSNCRFYRNYGCHKVPPVRLPREFSQDATAGNRVRNEMVRWGWPEVAPHVDWCGDWRSTVNWGLGEPFMFLSILGLLWLGLKYFR